ncbi:cell division protein kinase, putative [Entamoeba invadens IP1]|uniref:Cell division protein kinase, putative n=1 Tax=Entamoeba invadens IP1 TaxID=370355 RepID=A0A0A1UG07_ENTIV|nr:cell division protein kinase, putative [Entamoeba invadens IP1]ELP92109.1 cell division protein kinase, putative [Entamoeba invadens IP1]|eukprot:XP_004258880.1 cell division protein kinase, putative [Entamoeba invadens IP1]
MCDTLHSRFQFIAKLGAGTYGVVYKVRDTQKNRIVAIKKFNLENLDGDGITSLGLREVYISSTLRHKNINQILGVYSTTNELSTVMEYCDGSLRQLIGNPRFVNIRIIRYLFKQILTALLYCHEHRVFHRDLKPENIFVLKDLTVKLGDFGMARMMGDSCFRGYTAECICDAYAPPEMLGIYDNETTLYKPNYSEKVDIWAVGVMFSEMMGSTVNIQKLRMFPHKFQLIEVFPLLINEEDFSMATGMLQMDPRQRSSAKRVLQSNFFLQEEACPL